MGDTPYFRLFPSDFLNGIGGMDADQIAAYTVILMLIYDRQGPVAEDIDGWAWRLRMRRDRCQRAVNVLVSSGKLDRTSDGVFNRRAGKEIDYRRKKSKKASDNAHGRWEKSDKKNNENNGALMQSHCDGNAIPESIVHNPQSIVQEEAPSLRSGDIAQAELIPSGSNLRTPGKISPRSSTSKKLAKEKKIPWPDDFDLSGDMHRYAEEAGIAFNAIHDVWERFKAHHIKNGNCWAGLRGWQMAWQGWVRNEIKFDKERREKNGGGRPARVGYDPIEYARHRIEQLNAIEEEGTLWSKTTN